VGSPRLLLLDTTRVHPLVPLVTMRRGHKYQRCAAKFSFLFFLDLLTFILGSKCFGMLRGGTNRPRHSLSTWFHKKEREEWASKVRLPFFFITLYYVFNPPTAGSLTKGLDFNTRRKDDPSLRLRSPRFRHQEEGWPFISVPVVAGCIQN